MANRTASKDFNIFTPQQWQEGWNEMLVPGAYERGIFGDLMLPGIACGVRKILLIFNTNTNTPHDPIYIIDPSEFNVSPDTNIPVILSYNMSHYESMEPLTHDDVQATIDLIKDYKNGQYKYKNEDLPFLLNTESTSQENQIEAKKNIGNEKNKTELFFLGLSLFAAAVREHFLRSRSQKLLVTLLRKSPKSFPASTKNAFQWELP